MCNLYSITTSQQALRDLFKVRPEWERTGNLPPKYSVFPDGEAPVIRQWPQGILASTALGTLGFLGAAIVIGLVGKIS